jgi:nucleotide-binding universal stress UspA family protein
MITRILCPVDFSETSLAAAGRAGELARAAGAALVLLHVIDQGHYFLEARAHHNQLEWEDYERAAHQRLSALAAQLGHPDAETHVVLGRPRDVICSETGRDRADLIVMGTHGRSVFGKLFMGSVTESVVRSAHVPVMTVRA